MTRTITNEVLAEKIDVLAGNQRSLELKFEALPNQIDHSYVRADIFELRMKEIEATLLNIQAEIIKLQNRKTLINWMLPTLSAIAGSILTFLLIEYIKNNR